MKVFICSKQNSRLVLSTSRKVNEEKHRLFSHTVTHTDWRWMGESRAFREEPRFRELLRSAVPLNSSQFPHQLIVPSPPVHVHLVSCNGMGVLFMSVDSFKSELNEKWEFQVRKLVYKQQNITLLLKIHKLNFTVYKNFSKYM